jgi:hypothetical protein
MNKDQHRIAVEVMNNVCSYAEGIMDSSDKINRGTLQKIQNMVMLHHYAHLEAWVTDFRWSFAIIQNDAPRPSNLSDHAGLIQMRFRSVCQNFLLLSPPTQPAGAPAA